MDDLLNADISKGRSDDISWETEDFLKKGVNIITKTKTKLIRDTYIVERPD